MIITWYFKLFLLNNGEVHSWGMSKHGCLGLGENMLHTKNLTCKIHSSHNRQIVDIKAGNNHVLALNSEG